MIKPNQIIFLFIVAQVVSGSGCDQTNNNDRAEITELSANESALLKEQKQADIKNVTGSWVRTDAGYRIELSELYENGKIKAGYFNPDSIHVANTSWSNENGELKIYIELRDVNYPGSKYNLHYIREKDILAGEYFQAVEGNTYKVEFARKK
jgi:hypothetical protein